MIYAAKNEKSRQLRRMWELSIYDGDPDDPEVGIVKETVIAWNAVDAGRRAVGKRLALPPKFLHYVSWDEPPQKIFDSSGPTGEEAVPSIAYIDMAEDWSD
jgi:hypothetical protein